MFKVFSWSNNKMLDQKLCFDNDNNDEIDNNNNNNNNNNNQA